MGETAAMEIARVDVYEYTVTYVGGQFELSGGRVVESLSSTVVRLTADDGTVGFGETCPLGSAYLHGHSAGAQAALRELAPAVLHLDPREAAVVNEVMDTRLLGHGYAKSAIDVACWDLAGKAAGAPACVLLGGRRLDSYPLYQAVSLGSPAEMAAEVERLRAAGVRQFQLKLGTAPREDAERVSAVLECTGDDDLVIADANGAWRAQDAVVAARLLDGYERVYLEQPCPTLEECLYVRRLTRLPMVLDEVISDVSTLLRAHQAGGMDAINLKISKVGGLTRARQLRDLCETLGLSLTIEDTWGGDIATAAVSHLAASTSRPALFSVSFINDFVNEHIAGYRPRSVDSVGAAPEGEGLGIEVDVDQLGEPVFSVAQ
jgi:L-alanine-DL-glutamate epimerase-like enolase superfamily enzyme